MTLNLTINESDSFILHRSIKPELLHKHQLIDIRF